MLLTKSACGMSEVSAFYFGNLCKQIKVGFVSVARAPESPAARPRGDGEDGGGRLYSERCQEGLPQRLR